MIYCCQNSVELGSIHYFKYSAASLQQVSDLSIDYSNVMSHAYFCHLPIVFSSW
jgi:hypothetical protein